MDPLDPRRFPWADTPPDSRVWTLLPNQERIGVSPPPPFSGAGLGPQGGARSLLSRQRAGGAGGNSGCSRDARLGAAAASPGGVGARLSPVSSVPPPAAPAASSLPSPRRDTYRGRAAPRGRAGRRRRGPTSLGPWPRREREGAEGATVVDDLAPGWARSHPTQGGCGARMSLLKLWGPGSAIRGHFEGRGRPRRRRLHPWSW